MPYTSMQREFKEEIVSVKTIKDNNFHGGDKLHKDSPKYNIKINFNKNRKGGNSSQPLKQLGFLATKQYEKKQISDWFGSKDECIRWVIKKLSKETK